MTAELDDATFSVVRRGYDRAQVDDRLSRLHAELDAAAAGRNAAVEDIRTLTRQRDASRNEVQAARSSNQEARAELERLRAQVAELSIIPHTVDGMSERLQKMVRIAQDEVNDMRSRATASAAQVLTMAQAEADELRERSVSERREFEEERRAAEESLRAQLDETQTRLDQLRHDSDGQMARLDAELADRRSRAEQGLAADIEQQRTTMQQELAALEARHKEEAARILEVANQDARTRLAEATNDAQRVRAESRNDVAAAQRELEELRVLQHQISEQLTSVRALLDWTLPQISAGARGPESGQRPGPGPAGTVIIPSQQASQSERTAPRADRSDEKVSEPEAADRHGTDAAAEATAPTPAAGTPVVEAPATSGSAGQGNGDLPSPERPTPVARHSRITAPSGRR
jgi:chromosome segregation ATPase